MLKGMLKRALGVVAAAAMAVTGAVALSGTANAAETEPSITLNGDVAGRTFTAYPLGEYTAPQLNEDKTCVSSFSLVQNDLWAEPSIPMAALTAAAAAGETIPSKYAGSELAFIASFDTTKNSELLRNFANALAGSLSKPEAAATATAGDDDDSVVLNVSADGWYLVTDTVDGELMGTPILVGTKVNTAESTYLPLCSAGASTGTASVKPYETAAPEKKITDGSDDGTVTVGDTVSFEISNTIPNTVGHDHYGYVVVDQAGAGLQMPTDGNAYTVMVDRNKYVYYDPTSGEPAPQQYFTMTQQTETDGSTTTTITLNDVAGMDGLNVTVSYQAKVIDSKNIWNKAKTDSSGWNDPVEMKTYGFKFTKTDADGNALDGAKFVLKKDGKFLKQNEDKTWEYVDTQEEATEFAGKDGVFTFSGLEAGDYTVIETQVPTGYLETAKAEFTITIEAVGSFRLNTVDYDNAHDLASKKTSGVNGPGIYVMNVTSITQLPVTGAAGITMFIVLGLLIAGAGVTVYMKSRNVRRMMRA